MTKMKAKMRPVVVTTSYRGVFFGYTEDTKAEIIVLAQARNCLYWPAEQKGFIGLATTGPVAECRIGPAAESFEVRSITGVLSCSDEAVKAWERAPWRQ